ncbi:MAG: glycosyltransferase family 2 protein [Flavobacteriales bacterium]|nr:glycosyltransferase family 2 protein [Flavobacteriales bacterium]
MSYNSLELVKQFLPKIIEYTPKSDDYQIILVDNASVDDTQTFMKNNYPNIRVITLAENHGFTNGYVESLAQIEAKYYCLISSDIEVTPHFTEPIITLMEGDCNIAACQPKIMSWDRRNEFEYAGAAGGMIDHLGYPFARGRIIDQVEIDEGQYDNIQEVFWASGACMFVRADVYHKAGGLDNDYFAHMEEIDLCWRMKNMGYKIMFHPDAKVFHMGGFIIKYGSSAKVYRNHRNNLIMLLKNLPPYEGLWKIPLRFVMDFLTMIKMALDGNWKTIWAVSKAHQDFVFRFGKWHAKRIEAKKLWANRNHTGIYPHSMVWQYFVKKAKKFSDFNWTP